MLGVVMLQACNMALSIIHRRAYQQSREVVERIGRCIAIIFYIHSLRGVGEKGEGLFFYSIQR